MVVSTNDRIDIFTADVREEDWSTSLSFVAYAKLCK